MGDVYWVGYFYRKHALLTKKTLGFHAAALLMDEVLQFVDKYNSKYNHNISETAFVIPTSEMVYIRKHYLDSIPY